MSPKLRVAGIAASLAVQAALILLLARPSLDPARIRPIVLIGAAWIAFACAAWLVRKVAVRLAVGLILIGGIAVQVVALAGPPQSSSDLYRYIWDGRVQAAGIDPYLYAPGDAGVARLRNDFLWSSSYGDCVPNKKDSLDQADSLVAGCTLLNRPKVPTVYPPVAEAYFLAVQLAAPADDSTTPVQAAAAGCAVLITLILLFGLRRLGKDLRLAALWAWCPTVALEAGQNGHVDVVAVAFTAVALLLLARARTEGRTVLGGVLLGLAIATKVTPLLVVPAVLRRGWWLICVSAGIAISLVYAPHVMAVGEKIVGFFPGYLNQEGYSKGTGFAIIGLVVHGKLATVVAVVLLGLAGLAILRYGDPDQPWRGSVLMTAAALTVCTPQFPWYAILIVMLVALDGRPEWLAIAAGAYLTTNPDLGVAGITLHDPRAVGYGGGAAVAGVCAIIRYVLARRAGSVTAHEEPAAETVTADTTRAPETVTAGPAREAVPDAAEDTSAPGKAGSTVTVTIGADGTPSFDAKEKGSYRVLTGSE
jgi:Glycosyltransferase family 87